MAAPDPHRRTEYDLWSRSKKEGVKAVADALEAIADAKRARNALFRSGPDDSAEPSRQSPETDMLSDLLQLQFHYLTRLASIRNDYGAIGKRLLERAYTAVAGRPDAPCAELEFTDKDPDPKFFLVENRISPYDVEAIITVSPLQGPRPLPPLKDAITRSAPNNRHKENRDGSLSMLVPAGTPSFVAVAVDWERLRRNVRYRSTITVRIGSSVRRVVVHARRGAP